MTPMNGLQVIEAIKAGAQTPPPGIETLKLDQGWKWIKEIQPGRVVARWDYDSAYDNLERATIAGWVACLAEQAVFYASNTLIDATQVTRTTSLSVELGEPIKSGYVDFEAEVETYENGTMWLACRFRFPDGRLAARASAVVKVLSTSDSK